MRNIGQALRRWADRQMSSLVHWYRLPRNLDADETPTWLAALVYTLSVLQISEASDCISRLHTWTLTSGKQWILVEVDSLPRRIGLASPWGSHVRCQRLWRASSQVFATANGHASKIVFTHEWPEIGNCLHLRVHIQRAGSAIAWRCNSVSRPMLPLSASLVGRKIGHFNYRRRALNILLDKAV